MSGRKKDVEAAPEATVKPRKRGTSGLPQVTRCEGAGPVLQVLYNYHKAIDRDGAARVLLDIDARCDASVKLVVTGGAFVWITRPNIPDEGRWLRSVEGLRALTEEVREEGRALVRGLATKGHRDFIVGVDVCVGKDEECHAGQFAVVVRRGREEPVVVSKALPVGREDRYLAGFGTREARSVPRVVPTAAGRTLVLVCHDAQAFNHLTKARIDNADAPTPRAQALRAVRRQVPRPVGDRGGPIDCAVNLVHWVEEAGNTKTFRTSHRQLRDDRVPGASVYGAFGFPEAASDEAVASWAARLRTPGSRPGAIAIVR